MCSKLFCASLCPWAISIIFAYEQAVHLEKSRAVTWVARKMRRELAARAFVSREWLVLWYITLNYQNIVQAEIKLENLLPPFNWRLIPKYPNSNAGVAVVVIVYYFYYFVGGGGGVGDIDFRMKDAGVEKGIHISQVVR